MGCGLALTVSVPPGLVARSRIETTALSPALLACLLVLLTCALMRGNIGERGRTLILAPPGRGWMPTGRPAERHPVEAELSGTVDGEVELEGGLYRVGCRRLQA